MTTAITEAFELPRPEDIRAMGFVVKLNEPRSGCGSLGQVSRSDLSDIER